MGQKSKFAFPPQKDNISEENAFPQVMLLLQRYNIDIDAIDDTTEDGQKEKRVHEKLANDVLKEIKAGHLEIFEESGQVKVRQIIQHRSEKSTVKEVVYCEMTGEHQDNMPTGDGVSQYKQTTALMGLLCEGANGQFVVEHLKSSDRKTMLTLGLLFLAQ